MDIEAGWATVHVVAKSQTRQITNTPREYYFEVKVTAHLPDRVTLFQKIAFKTFTCSVYKILLIHCSKFENTEITEVKIKPSKI